MRGNGVFWRALERARRDALIAAGEAPPVAGSPGMTRRALIAGIAATTAAAALPRPARAQILPGESVAIIGGGIAGLTALHYLRKEGIDATLYEARTRMGGRMFTEIFDSGPAFEVGGQLVNTEHADMRKLAADFGIRLIDRKQEPHRTLILADGKALDEARVAEALGPIAAQIGKDADWLDKSFQSAAHELDRMTIADYCRKHAALFPEPWVRRLIESTSRTEYGVEPDKASAIELIFNLPTVDGTRFEVLGGSDERYVIEGGSGALPAAIAAKYADRIKIGKRLKRIGVAGSGLRLGFADGTSSDTHRVILAIPASLTSAVDFAVPLPAEWRAFIAVMGLGRNEKVQAVANAAPWRGPMGVGGELWETDPNGYALGWDGSVHLPERVSTNWTWFLGGDQVEMGPIPADLAKRFAASAEGAIPGLSAATADGPVRWTGWHRDPNTRGAYVNYGPGQLSRFAGLLAIEGKKRHVPGAGKILFAGEHLSDAWPGYMNGGAQTGRMAAEEILGKRLIQQAA